MRRSMLALIVLGISLFGTQCWAQTCGGVDQPHWPGITNTFSPGTTTNTYEFGSDGRLVVKLDTGVTTFTLTGTVNHTIDPIDTSEFPEGTACVPYGFGT